jgi:hypothetical protein
LKENSSTNIQEMIMRSCHTALTEIKGTYTCQDQVFVSHQDPLLSAMESAGSVIGSIYNFIQSLHVHYLK